MFENHIRSRIPWVIMALFLIWPTLSVPYPVFDDIVLVTCSECHTDFKGPGEATHDLHTATCVTCHDLVPDIPDSGVCSTCHGLADGNDSVIGLHLDPTSDYMTVYDGDSNGDYCNSSGCHVAWVGTETRSWNEVKSIFR